MVLFVAFVCLLVVCVLRDLINDRFLDENTIQINSLVTYKMVNCIIIGTEQKLQQEQTKKQTIFSLQKEETNIF